MDRLEEVVRELRGFVAEREWEQFHDPKNLVMAVASEAGELLAEYRWVSNAEADEYSKQEEHRKRIAAEAADVGIALLLFCDRTGSTWSRRSGRRWPSIAEAIPWKSPAADGSGRHSGGTGGASASPAISP